MRKRILSLSCLLLLCSCHGNYINPNETYEQETETETIEGNDESQNSDIHKDILPEFDQNKKYTVTFWAKNDTNKTQVNIYNKAISDFESYYPNIKVNIKTYTDYGSIYNDVITNIATGTTPDVCITYPDHIATYLSGNNTVAALDDYIFDSRYGLGGSEVKFDSVKVDEVVPQFLYEGLIDSRQYAIPFMRSTESCYVNKTYVERLGYELPEVLTWDYVWEVSEAAMEKSADGNFKVNGQKVMIPFIYKSTDNMMISMLEQQGFGYSANDGSIYLFNDYTRDILKTVYEHGANRSFSTFKISSYPANFLNAGQCIFAIDSTAGATWMGTDAPLVDIAKEQLVEFETVVLPIPQYYPDEMRMISQGPSICVFNKKDPGQVIASWLFAQYLMTNDVQIAYSQTEGYIPVTLKAQNSDAYKEYLALEGTDKSLHYYVKLQAAKLMLEHVDDTFVTSVFNGSAALRDAAGQLIEDAVKAGRRNQKFNDTEIDKEFKNIVSLFKLNQKNIKEFKYYPENPEVTPGETEAETEADDLITESEDYKDLGPLPTGANMLLILLIVVWVGIGFYGIFTIIKKRNKK